MMWGAYMRQAQLLKCLKRAPVKGQSNFPYFLKFLMFFFFLKIFWISCGYLGIFVYSWIWALISHLTLGQADIWPPQSVLFGSPTRCIDYPCISFVVTHYIYFWTPLQGVLHWPSERSLALDRHQQSWMTISDYASPLMPSDECRLCLVQCVLLSGAI